MNGRFRVDELCLLQKLTAPLERLNGEECIVQEAYGRHAAYDCQSGQPGYVMGYVVRCRAGIYVVQEQHLRRKDPPIEYSGEKRILELFLPATARELEPA
jgi:hypothetical protein